MSKVEPLRSREGELHVEEKHRPLTLLRHSQAKLTLIDLTCSGLTREAV